MSITHSRARQIIQEAFSKKVLQEDGEEQGGSIERPLADVSAIRKIINSRLQGKMEWRQGALMFLEFVLEFLEEGAQASDLLIICKELMGPSEGNRLYNTLKIMDLNANEISFKGCEAIAKYLSNESCSLESLHLANNRCSDYGAKVIAQAIAVNKSLIHLDMTYNSINDMGLTLFA